MNDTNDLQSRAARTAVSRAPSNARFDRSSAFIDTGAARTAVELALPMIECACRDRAICGAGFLCIVVLDPGIAPGEAPFEATILHEHAIGDRSAWDADYAAFARAKARVSWEHQRDAHSVQSLAPHRLRAGDTLLWGGVCLDGIVVGVSGAMPWYDEAFAVAVAANVRAIAKQRHGATLAASQVEAARM